MFESDGSKRVDVILYCLKINIDTNLNDNGRFKVCHSKVIIGECLAEELT